MESLKTEIAHQSGFWHRWAKNNPKTISHIFKYHSATEATSVSYDSD